MLNKYLLCISLLSATCIHAAETNKAIHAIIIPGLNSGGGKYGKEILKQHGIMIHDAGTIRSWIDLGQNNCIKHFKVAIDLLQKATGIGGIIILASSQGTATTFNYVAQHPEKVRMIIGEGIMASGNSAIQWTVDQCVIPKIRHVPGSYYILPFLAKIVRFWSYNPTGIQAIHSVDKIPNDIPVVLVHCKNDFQLAYSDAEAIYARLRMNGNENAYLIPIERDKSISKYDQRQHIDLIEPNSPQSAIIDAILVKHNLSPRHDAQNRDKKILPEKFDLTPYQPKPNNAAYTRLITLENRLRTIVPFVKWSICAGIVFLGYRFLAKNSLMLPSMPSVK
jgi:hypothetical protein